MIVLALKQSLAKVSLRFFLKALPDRLEAVTKRADKLIKTLIRVGSRCRQVD